MTYPLRLGNEEFWLDVGDAAEVKLLCVTDRQAALTLARRRARKASVTVPMMMMDGAPTAAAQPLRDAAPSPPQSQTTRTTTMNPMVKIRIGDAERYVDANVAREIETLRGENAALKAMRDGAVQPVAAQPVTDALTASRLAARDALRAQEARNNDPSTAQGQYRQYLRNAHLGNRG
jgi:hypothetical protein